MLYIKVWDCKLSFLFLAFLFDLKLIPFWSNSCTENNTSDFCWTCQTRH